MYLTHRALESGYVLILYLPAPAQSDWLTNLPDFHVQNWHVPTFVGTIYHVCKKEVCKFGG